MTTTIAAPQPAPEPRQRSARPPGLRKVPIRAAFPLFRWWEDCFPTPDGESVVISQHVWATFWKWRQLGRAGMLDGPRWKTRWVGPMVYANRLIF